MRKTKVADVKGGQKAGAVPSLVNALAVLEYVSQSRQACGVNHIARDLGISPSSCFNILKTLTAHHFLEFDAEDKTYSFGAGALMLANRVTGENGMLDFVLPRMQHIADKFHLTVGLWRLSSARHWVALGFRESPDPARIHVAIGHRMPIYAGALGRCAAVHADLSPSQLTQALNAVRWYNKPSEKAYRAELQNVREQGWALDTANFLMGVSTLGAPIFDGDGKLRYAIAATMFAQQLNAPALQELGKAVRHLTQRATVHLLGCSPGKTDAIP